MKAIIFTVALVGLSASPAFGQTNAEALCRGELNYEVYSYCTATANPATCREIAYQRYENCLESGERAEFPVLPIRVK